jgi:hypothetical protein
MFVAYEELNSRISGRDLIILDRQFAAVRPSPGAQQKTKYAAERYDDQAETGAGEQTFHRVFPPDSRAVAHLDHTHQ